MQNMNKPQFSKMKDKDHNNSLSQSVSAGTTSSHVIKPVYVTLITLKIPYFAARVIVLSRSNGVAWLHLKA